ncbi:MAG: AI-2E family transporter [Micrococcales bacterium]
MSENKNTRLTNGFQFGLLGGLGVLTALTLGSMVTSLANIFTYVFAAIYIALGLDPVVSFLERRKMRRPLAIATVLVVFFGLIGSLIWAAAPTLVHQTERFMVQAPSILKDATALDWVVRLDAQFGGAISNALNSFGTYLSDAKNWPELLGGVVQVGITIFNGFFAGLIIMILTIYFMASLHGFKEWLYRLVAKRSRQNFISISEQISNSIGRYVIGQVSIAATNAILGFIMMTIVGVNYSVLLAFVTFFFAMIPLVGSVTGGAIVSLVALSVSPTAALVMAIYYVLYMQVEAYVISPRVMRRAVDVPGAVVVVAALAGGTLLGILGALVAIPVAASIILIIRQVWMPKQDLEV